MECNAHPGVDAIGTCTSCGKNICEGCAVEVEGKLVCRDCLSAGKTAPRKYDPNTAFIIEMVGGFFGLLGIGYFYVGKSQDGVLRLVVWFIYNALAYIAIVLLSSILIGLVCIPFQLAIQIGVPLWSANTLKKQLLSEEEAA